VRMHKRQVWMKLLQKQSLTKCQRGDLVGYGGESGDSGLYIASVGSPSERCNNFVRTRAAMGTCRHVESIRTVLLTVRPVVAARVLTKAGPVRTIGLHSVQTPREYRPDPLSVRTAIDTVRTPIDTVRTPIDTVRTLHTESEKLRKIHRNQIFQVSFRIPMYKPLITQLESISILNKDIKRELRN
jgi:hypothetical protein